MNCCGVRENFFAPISWNGVVLYLYCGNDFCKIEKTHKTG